MTDILIVYGSTSGNTELVCETIAKVLDELGHNVLLQRVEQTQVEELRQHDLVILGASTYGHGILQDQFIPFAEKMKSLDLSGKDFAVVGLGDSKYDAEYNIESAVILENIVLQQGGKLIAPALMINKSPIPKLSKIVPSWAEGVHGLLSETAKK